MLGERGFGSAKILNSDAVVPFRYLGSFGWNMGETVMSGEKSVRMEKEESASASKGELKGLMRWEKFLPRMILRVLLVEADDSTRQIIAALLRKCSYKG